MVNWIAAGICAGLAAAVLQAAVLYPSPVTMVAFYLSALPAATARLKSFFTKASTAGAAFDDAATGQALVNFFARALNSGAITIEEAAQTGLTESELRTASFRQILSNRLAKNRRA